MAYDSRVPTRIIKDDFVWIGRPLGTDNPADQIGLPPRDDDSELVDCHNGESGPVMLPFDLSMGLQSQLEGLNSACAQLASADIHKGCAADARRIYAEGTRLIREGTENGKRQTMPLEHGQQLDRLLTHDVSGMIFNVTSTIGTETAAEYGLDELGMRFSKFANSLAGEVRRTEHIDEIRVLDESVWRFVDSCADEAAHGNTVMMELVEQALRLRNEADETAYATMHQCMGVHKPLEHDMPRWPSGELARVLSRMNQQCFLERLPTLGEKYAELIVNNATDEVRKVMPNDIVDVSAYGLQQEEPRVRDPRSRGFGRD